ncbi:hypothetical protein [Actinomadura geliboluensis]|uniref:hypothetical protein n=1 Tax=Actinomadura geliboluensis TaxID=882440 RepID=UPI00371EAE2D
MAYPSPRRRSPVPLILALLALVLVLAVCAVLAAVLLTRSDDDPPPTATAGRLSATGIVSILDRQRLVSADTCRAETGAPPATSQSRCDLGDGAELIAMGFQDGAGVRARLGGWLGEGTLVRGPNWLVNVADLDDESQEAVRAALGGTLVKLPA